MNPTLFLSLLVLAVGALAQSSTPTSCPSGERAALMINKQAIPCSEMATVKIGGQEIKLSGSQIYRALVREHARVFTASSDDKVRLEHGGNSMGRLTRRKEFSKEDLEAIAKSPGITDAFAHGRYDIDIFWADVYDTDEISEGLEKTMGWPTGTIYEVQRGRRKAEDHKTPTLASR